MNFSKEQMEKFKGMLDNQKGYELTVCRGGSGGGCPFVIREVDDIIAGITAILEKVDLNLLSGGRAFLLPHQRIKVSIAACPNACSQPQIKGIGIIAQSVPDTGEGGCINCGLCVAECKEGAITIVNEEGRYLPKIDRTLCLNCGMCVAVCETGALKTAKIGYKLLSGGKLGRHPRLAKEAIACADKEELLKTVQDIITDILRERGNSKR